ncbi:MAG TPA: ATP-binding protein [Chryseolinea sp.]|nr:ATP-binding protein [Chryseolinea sp.]
MKVYFDKKVLVGFLVAIVTLVSLGIYSYKNSQDSIITSRMVSHTNEVLYRIEKLHSLHLEIEAELTRYVLTGDTTFADFYRDKINGAREHYMALFELIKGNSTLLQGIDSIRLLGMKKVELINHVISLRKNSGDSAQMVVFSPANRKLVNGINSAVESMQAEEKKTLDHRMTKNQHGVTKFYTTFLTLLIVTVFTIVVLFLLINMTLRARLQAEEALSRASEEIKSLYNEAPCGYHSLNADGLIIEMNRTWLNWIGYTRDEVINKIHFVDLFAPASKELYKEAFPIFKSQGFITNVEFELITKNGSALFVILSATAIKDKNGNFMKSRSTAFNITDRHLAEEKVIEANKELEAFTYSVSHDLRAPLRSIDGYSKILQEDYSSTLDREANRLLQIIRKNAHRMGHLIDDLLDFSRMGRKELDRTTLDMSALVANVRRELVSHELNRKIEFKVKPLNEARGDLSMMRQLWINLISNALKYSRRQEVSRIEIGCKSENNQVVYYIQDNGVGFDMKYADKLFGVFQRLHKVEEFDGTGVGLALVHRIVTRHGGKIWAEGRINEGATFFFFIPAQNVIQ